MRNTMNLPGVAILAFFLVSPSVLAQLPSELAHLEEIALDELQVVEAARRFDLQQKSLIEWDGELIAQYGREGRGDLVRTKQDDIYRRVELIGEAWEFIVDRYPNNARALNYQGEYLYDYAGDPLKATRNWTISIQLDNKLGAPHNNLGLHHFHQGDYKVGLNHLERALELDKNNPDYLYNMSQMYLLYFPQIGAILGVSKKKLFGDAMSMAKKATELLPEDHAVLLDYATNFYAAQNFEVEVDWEEAATAWGKVSAVADTHQERFYASLNEGRTWLRAGENEKAVEALNRAGELERDNRVVVQLLGEARKAKG